MNCPECQNELRWSGDEQLMGENELESMYECDDCNIEVIKRINVR